MNTKARNRSRHQCRFDSLESRELMNAHLPSMINFRMPAASIAHDIHAKPATFHHASNAHIHEAHAAHAESQTPQVHRVISGTLTGTSIYNVETTTPTYLGTDTYAVSGTTTNAGTATVTGSDTALSPLINPTTYNDLYYGGNWTMTLSGGNTLQVAYTGSGTSYTNSPGYTAILKGTAVVTAGPLEGQIFNFSASMSGNGDTDAVTLNFTLSQ